MLSGLIWYLLRWLVLRKRGLALNEVFRSLPPEG
jgi:hypothetical protein